MEVPPSAPTLAALEAQFSADIAAAIGEAPPDPENNYEDLTSKLTLLSVKKKIELLELDPSDGENWQERLGIRRIQATLVQGTENNVVRADENVMKRKAVESLLPALLENLKLEKAKLEKIDALRRERDRSVLQHQG